MNEYEKMELIQEIMEKYEELGDEEKKIMAPLYKCLGYQLMEIELFMNTLGDGQIMIKEYSNDNKFSNIKKINKHMQEIIKILEEMI